MLKGEIRSFAFAFLVLSFGSVADAQGTFTIDIPGATFTRVVGLNAQGDVCGGTLVKGNRLAFAGSRRADFTDLTTFAYPGSVFTQCRGINAAGQMVGTYQSADTKAHAFVKNGSELISIDVPGSIETRGFGIDPLGQIVGRYMSPDAVSTDSSAAAMGLSARSTSLELPRLRPQGLRHKAKSRASTERPTEGFMATSYRGTGSTQSTFRAPSTRS